MDFKLLLKTYSGTQLKEVFKELNEGFLSKPHIIWPNYLFYS